MKKNKTCINSYVDRNRDKNKNKNIIRNLSSSSD